MLRSSRTHVAPPHELATQLGPFLLEHRRDRQHPARVDQLAQIAPHELGEREHELRENDRDGSASSWALFFLAVFFLAVSLLQPVGRAHTSCPPLT